jgi:succinate dehydrogenase/fumarate reductase flavoprotein subunit
MYHSALARTETRGMSKRADFPDLDQSQHHHILTGGLDEVWTAAGALKGAELQVAS